MASTETRVIRIEDLPPIVLGGAGDAIVIEGDDATAFLESMASGPVDEEYLRECDRVYERLYRPEPTNNLFR